MTILWHKHHIIPKHFGGSNDPSNIIRVNVACHAFLHKCLWEQHGKIEDFLAWKGLEKKISKEQITRMIISHTQKGRKHSEESIKKRSESLKGRKRSLSEKMAISKGKKGKKINSEGMKLKSFYVDNNYFKSYTDAAKIYNCSIQTVINRLKSDKFSNWKLSQ